MFAGTSIGALTAMMICIKRMSAKDIAEVLSKNACNDIMDKSIWDKMFNLIQHKPKYTGKGKTDVINNILGDVKLSDTNEKRLVIPGYDIENRKGIIFNSHNCNKELLAREVANATSAAPAYFPCSHVSNCWSVDQKDCNSWFIDGGMIANNPTIDAIAEAMDIIRKSGEVRKIMVVNIGTGHRNRCIKGHDAKDYGGPEWLNNDIIGIAMDESLVSERVQKILGPGCYIGINHELTDASDDLDDCSEENLNALIRTGEKWWDDNKYKFKKFFRALNKNG